MFGFGQLIEQDAAILRFRLGTRFGERPNRRFRFALPALLDQEFMLLADEILKFAEISELRADLHFIK